MYCSEFIEGAKYSYNKWGYSMNTLEEKFGQLSVATDRSVKFTFSTPPITPYAQLQTKYSKDSLSIFGRKNSLSAALIEELLQQNPATSLQIRCCSLEKGSLQALQKRAVRALSLEDCTYTECFPDLPTIEELDLWSMKITDDQMNTIAKQRKLHSLTIGYCTVASEDSFKPLAPLPLQKLVVIRTAAFTEKAFVNFLETTKSSLEYLQVDPCPFQDAALKSLERHQKLTSLRLRHCSSLSDACTSSIAKCTALQVLEMHKAPLVTLQGMKTMSPCKDLRQLNVSECTKLSDQTMDVLAQFTDLRVLNVSGCPITDDGLLKISKLIHLRVLNVDECNALTGKTVPSLKNLSDLQNLSFGTMAFKAKYATSFKDLPALTYLDMTEATLDEQTANLVKGSKQGLELQWQKPEKRQTAQAE